MRDFENGGRSLAIARHGMAATSHPASTLAALDILRAGGNALDAAVAACAVQNVVEPGSTGIGGDCFCLIAPKGGAEVIAYNGSGRAPAAATPEWFAENGIKTLERQSPHSVTIPGAVEAWDRLVTTHGTMPLKDILKPAVTHARDGYALTPRALRDWIAQRDLLAKNESAAAVFLPNGEPPRLGAVHRQPELADTLESIGEGGARAFYEGRIAEDMVASLRALGGLHTLEDFAAARGEFVEPVKTSFRGHEVWECPPNGQGIIALLILNILSRFEGKGDPLSPDRLHLEIEATRLAYGVRNHHLADPAMADVPAEWMLSDRLADELAAKIDLARALDPLPAEIETPHRDTVYISVVDKDRNAVSFINSIFHNFGSGIMSRRSGVLFHNRGESFVLDPKHPNCIAPGKRPLHTIIPGMLTKDDRTVMPFGVMGGHYQAMGHAHLVSKVLDYGMDLQSAMELPRLFPLPGTMKVEAERSLRESVGPELERRGFEIVPPAAAIGGSQAVMIDWEQGTLQGGSDPRKDGCALGY